MKRLTRTFRGRGTARSCHYNNGFVQLNNQFMSIISFLTNAHPFLYPICLIIGSLAYLPMHVTKSSTALNASWKFQQQPNAFMWVWWRLRVDSGFLIMYMAVCSLWGGLNYPASSSQTGSVIKNWFPNQR